MIPATRAATVAARSARLTLEGATALKSLVAEVMESTRSWMNGRAELASEAPATFD